MKKITFILVTTILVLISGLSVCATDIDDIDNIEEEIGNQLFSSIDNDIADILDEIGINDLSFENIYNISFENITSFFADTLKDKVKICLKTFFELLGIVMLTGIISAFFNKDSDDNFISLTSVVIITILTVNIISGTLSAVISVLQLSSKFMQSFVPIYTLIISLGGNPASALTYNTLIIAFAEFISYVITSGITDVLGVFFCLSISFTLNSSINISRLISAINKFVGLTLGLFASLFSGFLSIKSILSASVDSVSVKSIRFLISSLIPVVGSSISEAYSSLLGSINIIKGSVAVIGILVVMIINIPVIFETLAYYISFSMLSYVAESVSASRSGDILRCFSCGMRILMLVCVFEMFILIISTGVLLSVKNGG